MLWAACATQFRNLNSPDFLCHVWKQYPYSHPIQPADVDQYLHLVMRESRATCACTHSSTACSATTQTLAVRPCRSVCTRLQLLHLPRVEVPAAACSHGNHELAHQVIEAIRTEECGKELSAVHEVDIQRLGAVCIIPRAQLRIAQHLHK